MPMPTLLVCHKQVDYREKLFNGEDLLFVINGFHSEDYDALKNKLRIYEKKDLGEIEDPTLIGLILIKSTKPDLDLARYYFELALKLEPGNNVAKVYLAIALFNSNYNNNYYVEKAYQLLNSVYLDYENNKYNNFFLLDLKDYLAEVEFYRQDPDYKRIIKLLKKGNWKYNDLLIYILGYSYFMVENYIEAKKLLSKINNTREFRDVPNILNEINLRININ